MPIGEWVLRQACRDAAKWPEPDQGRGQPVGRCSSRAAIWSRRSSSALAASGLPAQRLELEITESVLLQNNDATLATLHQLRDARRAHRHGRFRHRLFLAQLPAQFPVRQDQDRPLLRRATFGRRARTHRDRTRGRRARPQSRHGDHRGRRRDGGAARSVVRAEGCTEVQGYLFSPPRPIAEIEQLFLSRAEKIVRVG